jgi:hypothetical protein
MRRFILFVLLSVSLSCSAQVGSQELIDQLTEVLKSAEGRQKLKGIFSDWTPEQRETFASGLKQKLEASMVPHLPMKIDSDTIWLTLRTTDTGMYQTVQLSDSLLSESGYFESYRPIVLNHMCSTPINALLLLMNHKIYVSYYNPAHVFQKQFIFSEKDCGF